jgi:hypothetical protein
MENFFYDNEFYSDLDSLMDDLDLNAEADIYQLPDDWFITCFESKREPIFILSVDFITDAINEERFSEEGREFDEINEVLSNNIDYEKINALIPNLYYPTRTKFLITRADLINYIK